MDWFIEDEPAKSDTEKALQGKQRYRRGQRHKAKAEKESCQRACQCQGAQEMQLRHAGKRIRTRRVPCQMQAAETDQHLHKEIQADGKQGRDGWILRLQKAVLDRKEHSGNRHIQDADPVASGVLGMMVHAEP